MSAMLTVGFDLRASTVGGDLSTVSGDIELVDASRSWVT